MQVNTFATAIIFSIHIVYGSVAFKGVRGNQFDIKKTLRFCIGKFVILSHVYYLLYCTLQIHTFQSETVNILCIVKTFHVNKYLFYPLKAC